MPSRYEQISFEKLNLIPIDKRCSLVNVDSFPSPARLTKSEADALLKTFPHILAGDEFTHLLESLRKARTDGTPRIWTMGAHPVKVGISRHLIALIEAGYITHLAVNGAFTVHDTEIACFGHTSEDVAGTIVCGQFAVTKETGEIINASVNRAYSEKLGFGEALGEDILNSDAPNLDACVSAACYRLGIPFTVHTAIGTDVFHIHPTASGAAIGDTSYRDFRIFTSSVSKLQSGVIVNLGSAVILPVVIEKSIAAAQNLGYKLAIFDGYNLDFMKHYRSNLNPVKRAIESGGHGAHIIGHHEITIPLLSAILLAK
jgi:hypothetical protein